MFEIKTEKDYTIRTYTASSYFDAIDLFHNLTKVLPFVQVWYQGKLIMGYNPNDESDIDYETDLHIAEHYMK